MQRILFFSAFLLFSSCASSGHNKQEVEAAMKYYDHLILTSNADSISLLYTPDGNLGNIAIGRDSIRKFLSSFKNIKVLSQSSISASVQIDADTAIQKGTYQQSDIIAGKDTVHVKGEFTATWQWMPNKTWHIKKMTTQPIK